MKWDDWSGFRVRDKWLKVELEEGYEYVGP
jgi:hypothetical protein